MLTDRARKGPQPDPDEWLTGTCATCKTVVRKQRWECSNRHRNKWIQKGDKEDFLDRSMYECPKCKADSLKKIGTTVYMVKEKSGV